jgi:hypothetical protein
MFESLVSQPLVGPYDAIPTMILLPSTTTVKPASRISSWKVLATSSFDPQDHLPPPESPPQADLPTQMWLVRTENQFFSHWKNLSLNEKVLTKIVATESHLICFELLQLTRFFVMTSTEMYQSTLDQAEPSYVWPKP